MQLTIKDLSGKVIFVEISDFNETVEIVKLRVFQKEFISPDVQHLVYKSHILKDKCKLLSYGIMEGCPINLVVRPVPNEINDSSSQFMPQTDNKINITIFRGELKDLKKISNNYSVFGDENGKESLPQDDNPAQIFVYSLNSCTTEQQLKKYFSKAGHVLSIYIPTSNGQKRGFAFITLKDKKDIPKALETIRQKLLIGCQLRGVVIQNSIDFIGPGNNDLLLIDQIFDSQSTTDDEKAEQLKLLFQKFFKLNDYKQLVNLNYEAFYMINSHLKDCQTAPELVLLDSIVQIDHFNQNELLQPILKYYSSGRSNQFFFNDLKQSGLFIKLESILKQRVDFEDQKKVQSFSAITEQVLQTYLQIKKQQDFQEDILGVCSKIVSLNMQSITENIKNHYNDNIQQEDRKIYDDKIRSMIKTLQLMNPQAFNYDMKTILTNKMNIHQDLSPLLHLNCSQPQCQFNINVEITPLIQELQTSVYNLLGQLITEDNKLSEYLQNTHQIFLHLKSIFISYNNSNSKQQQLLQQQQSLTFQSPNLIMSYLKLLRDLLYSNHDNSCQAMIETPNLISSMVKIYDYKLNEIINQDQEREGKYIRETISQCFREIKYYGNKSSQEQLCDAGFIAYMTKAISTAGGCSQYNDGIIIWSLSNIDIFLYYLLFGRKAVNAHETEKPPLPHLAVGQKESFEEEGGDEEVDSQIFNINKGHSDNPQKFAKSARIEILNVFVDRKNRKFR